MWDDPADRSYFKSKICAEHAGKKIRLKIEDTNPTTGPPLLIALSRLL
jgi:hypothetical protein